MLKIVKCNIGCSLTVRQHRYTLRQHRFAVGPGSLWLVRVWRLVMVMVRSCAALFSAMLVMERNKRVNACQHRLTLHAFGHQASRWNAAGEVDKASVLLFPAGDLNGKSTRTVPKKIALRSLPGITPESTVLTHLQKWELLN